MYSPWYYGVRYPPLSPYLTAIYAERKAEATDRQNFLLSKQVVQLARQNVDLRTKIVQLNADKLSRYDKYDPKHMGYSKEALETAYEIQIKRQKKQQFKPNRTQIKNQTITRSYSFGNTKNQNNRKSPNSITKSVDNRRNKTTYQSTPQKQEGQKQRKYKYIEEDKLVRNQKGTNTFIQRLHQSKMNPQNQERENKPIIRIQSQAYNEPSRYNQKQAHSKKDNKVYLQGQEIACNSPISKLKTIKKLNQSQIPSSRKSIGKKQYLSLIGNIFENVRNQNKPLQNSEQKKQIVENQKQKE